MNLPSKGLVDELDLELSRTRTLWTIPEAAEVCGRSVKTIRNLLSKHQLPVRRAWRVRRYRRYRETTLSARTVATLVGLTRLAVE